MPSEVSLVVPPKSVSQQKNKIETKHPFRDFGGTPDGLVRLRFSRIALDIGWILQPQRVAD